MNTNILTTQKRLRITFQPSAELTRKRGKHITKDEYDDDYDEEDDYDDDYDDADADDGTEACHCYFYTSIYFDVKANKANILT